MLSILLSLGVWLLLSTLSSFAINAMTEFNPIVISFVMFLSCCCCANIVMADAVNLFPTSHRGMATSFIFMLGRLGAFAGSNVVGALLVNLCTSIFYLYGGLLIGKFSLQNLWPLQKTDLTLEICQFQLALLFSWWWQQQRKVLQVLVNEPMRFSIGKINFMENIDTNNISEILSRL